MYQAVSPGPGGWVYLFFCVYPGLGPVLSELVYLFDIRSASDLSACYC